MSEKYRMVLPAEVHISDTTLRDGIQPLEHFFPTEQKLHLAEELILAGFKRIEITNLGNPKYMPQFKDAETLMERLFQSQRVGSRLRQNGGDVSVSAVTINEKAVTRALDFKLKHGYGPDIVLQMVSTDPAHHKVNSNMTHEEYWGMTERCITMAKEQGIEMCGTVSTIWGSPMEGHRMTDLHRAVEFSRIYLDLGAAYIEHADNDGSADPARVFEYFKMILDEEMTGKWAHPEYHLAHLHTSRGMGASNCLAALQAGVCHFETTMSGIGGQPANMIDGVLTVGTGNYYHQEHLLTGLPGAEDTVVMMESMGIKTGIDIPGLFDVGRMFRDQFLQIAPADMAAMAKNVSHITGINLQRLYSLKESEASVDRLMEEATAFIEQSGKGEARKDTVVHLLNTLRGYLISGTWGPSRAETLMSNIPPSPYLKHLLRSP